MTAVGHGVRPTMRWTPFGIGPTSIGMATLAETADVGPMQTGRQAWGPNDSRGEEGHVADEQAPAGVRATKKSGAESGGIDPEADAAAD
jgi:hypothetical protein